ncbi:hypothetical protein O3M35_008356 [Rhynocoris fuscipes]|uniref:Uncharacterized protein n=1 Tax=Rhynocoris fuscipes TaxID=488301 RepID=A0AAW1D8A3_9HEMI
MLKDYESKQYVDKVENFGKKFITTFLLFGLSNPVLGFIIFITHDLMTNFEKKRLIIQIWLPWSTEETLPYLAANILATLMTVSICAVYTGLDVLDFTYTFQVSTNLKVLQNLLETKGIKDKKFYEMHNVIIESHLGKYGNIVHKNYSNPFTLTPVMTIRRAEETIQYDALSKMACCMAPPLVACCCGQEIITQMERLHEASYMSNWYQENPKVRKDLLTMMIRTTKPSTVNYRMFLTFDHEYLAKVNNSNFLFTYM